MESSPRHPPSVSGRPAVLWGALLVVVGVWGVVLASRIPPTGGYHLGADEGTYLRQASALLDEGLGAPARLARDYVASASAHDFPPPVRLAHMVLSAAALRLSPGRSILSLSGLSLAYHLATALLVFAWVRRLCSPVAAWAGAVLVVFSPLGSGLAARALSDTHYALAVTLAVLSLVAFLTQGGAWAFRLFLVGVAWSLLVKEVGYLLVPLWCAVLGWARWRLPERVSWRHVALGAIVPALVLAGTAMLLGGPTAFVQVMQAHYLEVNDEYGRLYSMGPWYEYPVDLAVLSPVPVAAYFGLAGAFVLGDRSDRAAGWLLVFAASFFVTLVPFSKNCRAALPLDVLMRAGLVATASWASKSATWRWRAFGAAGALWLMVGLDVHAFYRVFVVADVYDPVAFNLLRALRFIPGGPP